MDKGHAGHARARAGGVAVGPTRVAHAHVRERATHTCECDQSVVREAQAVEFVQRHAQVVVGQRHGCVVPGADDARGPTGHRVVARRGQRELLSARRGRRVGHRVRVAHADLDLAVELGSEGHVRHVRGRVVVARQRHVAVELVELLGHVPRLVRLGHAEADKERPPRLLAHGGGVLQVAARVLRLLVVHKGLLLKAAAAAAVAAPHAHRARRRLGALALALAPVAAQVVVPVLVALVHHIRGRVGPVLAPAEGLVIGQGRFGWSVARRGVNQSISQSRPMVEVEVHHGGGGGLRVAGCGRRDEDQKAARHRSETQHNAAHTPHTHKHTHTMGLSRGGTSGYCCNADAHSLPAPSAR